jgi:hypothetical protein
MTFRPSVVPDRDNDILSTFVRSFERARQNRRADQADARAQQEHVARQEDREALRDDKILSANLAVASDPGLSFSNEFEINQEGIGLNEVPTGSGLTQALGPSGTRTRPGVEVGRGPGGRSIFRSEEATQQGRRESVIRDAQTEFDAGEPERRETRAEEERESATLRTALQSVQPPIPPAQIEALVQDPVAARQRLNLRATERARTARPPTDTGTERLRAQDISAIEERASDANMTLQPGQAETLARSSAAQIEDFFSDFPKAERDQLQSRVDDLVEQLSRIDENRGLLSISEQNSARIRAIADSGFEGRAGLNAAQERLREFSEGQGAIRSRGTGAGGPADVDGSALGEIPTGADKMSPQQREEFGVVVQGLSRADAITMIRTAEPGATQADIDAILALQGI